jgi:peptidoglycan hydrolase-like protein with peptidoglycan-binding domain
MTLQSQSFSGDPKLEAAAVSDPSHILTGAEGDHVSKIQRALMQLDGAVINPGELGAAQYGPSTADAVLAFKQKRNIINHSYQTQADNIVGKMTMVSLDKEILAKESEDPDFIFLSDGQKAIVKNDLFRSKQMLDVVLKRLQVVANTTPSGGLLVTPRNLTFYDTKLKILNVFHINTFISDDLPVPPEVLETLRQSFRGLTALPAPSNSPADAINFATLLQNYTQLRWSLEQKFRKEFYTLSKFKGQPLGFFAAFVDATNPADSTVRITRKYFDVLVVPTTDDRAVTLVHERAHTIFRANGHPGTGDNPFCVAPHLGDPNVQRADQALANPYCYEWLIDSLQPDYNAGRFRGPECGT